MTRHTLTALLLLGLTALTAAGRHDATAQAATAEAPGVSGRSDGSDEALTPREIARRALDFTVLIEGGGRYGTGVVLASSLVLTCHHVIEGIEQVEVVLHGGSRRKARLVEVDTKLDLALLEIDRPAHAIATPASITGLVLGDELYAMGAPRKMAFSLSRGIVSHLGRPFDGVHYLQTDIPANTGSSGSPVMNERGEVVALMSFVFRDTEGLAFATPIDYAYRRFAHHLGKRPLDLAAFDRWLGRLSG